MFALKAVIQILGININLTIFLYIFIVMGAIAFIIYLLNLLFRRNKFKNEKVKDEKFIKRKALEKDKENLDKEILSIVKNRKEQSK